MTSHVFGTLASDASDVQRARDAGQSSANCRCRLFRCRLSPNGRGAARSPISSRRSSRSDFRDREHAGSVLVHRGERARRKRGEVLERQDGHRVALRSRARRPGDDRDDQRGNPRTGRRVWRQDRRRLVADDPEAMFADGDGHPPETGGAGIGLIVLRKDYGATIGVRLLAAFARGCYVRAGRSEHRYRRSRWRRRGPERIEPV